MMCNGCGDCCDPVYLAPGLRMKALRNEITVDEEDRRWAIELKPNGDGYYTCPRFDSEARNCGDYEGRPPVCRDYPWYNKPPHESLRKPDGGMASQRCVFWSELPVAISGLSIKQ